MNVAAQYRRLLALGRDEFLASAAPAALIRYRVDDAVSTASSVRTLTPVPGEADYEDEATLDESVALARAPARDQAQRGEEPELELFPLVKKPGASFPDRITIGRTSNNDIAIADTSVSRLHAYVRRDGNDWVVADAGSKNGSWLRGARLEARKEQRLVSRALLRIGEIDLTFYLATDLFAALGGRP